MNLDENLRNATQVLRATYDNIVKLTSFLKTKALEFGFRSVSGILMWQSKTDIWGWVTSKFTLLFQHSDKPMFENGWADDDIFGVEICLEDDPGLYISKYTYADCLDKWSPGCSNSSEWIFSHARWNNDKFIITTLNDGKILSKPKDEKVKQKHWGLEYAVFRRDTFYDLTADNVKNKIFAVMDELAQYKKEEDII